MNLRSNPRHKMHSLLFYRKLSGPISLMVLLSLLFAVIPARADDEDDIYLSILTVIEQGDALNAKGQAAAALEKYRQADAAMITFQKTYPKWNVKVIAYRARYLGEKMDALTEKIKLATPAPASHDTNASPATGSKGSSIARIKLLDPGSEPRSVLRFHPKVGDKHTLNMLLKMGMGVKMGDTEAPQMKLPRMSMAMDVTVTDISQDGDIGYEMQVSDAGVADDPDATPAVAAAMKSSLANFKGASGKGTMSNRGVSETSELKLPANADPQTKQVMDSMKESISSSTVPLPEEAVGPGAKWEVKQKRKAQGLSIDETVTYELASLDKDRLTAKSTIAQEAAHQKIENPSMPGIKIDLDKMTAAGTGNFTLDLSQMVPVEGNADIHSDMSMGMGAGAQKQSMAMKMDVSVSLEGK